MSSVKQATSSYAVRSNTKNQTKIHCTMWTWLKLSTTVVFLSHFHHLDHVWQGLEARAHEVYLLVWERKLTHCYVAEYPQNNSYKLEPFSVEKSPPPHNRHTQKKGYNSSCFGFHAKAVRSSTKQHLSLFTFSRVLFDYSDDPMDKHKSDAWKKNCNNQDVTLFTLASGVRLATVALDNSSFKSHLV